jgi:hypothetical protein
MSDECSEYMFLHLHEHLYSLLHIHQKKKIALEIAAKIASVSWSYTGNKIAATCNKI